MTTEFFVRLCGDVILEILNCGNRLQLVKLELVGRRFHWMVENFFDRRPFLRLSLKIDCRFVVLIFVKIIQVPDISL